MDDPVGIVLRDAAQAMQAATGAGRLVAPMLAELYPPVARQIRADRDCPALFRFWGRSLNRDESGGQPIVHPSILAGVGTLAGVPMRGRAVHAGLQHTYGYLFSLIQTPYGLKRDRWVSEDWEVGFGFERSLLGPDPRAGTLLANLTWFMGRVAYRGRAGALARLRRIAPAVAPELAGYDFDRLRVCRVEEHAPPVAGGRGVRVVTDLVPYPRGSAAGDAVLVYSVQNGRDGAQKLITAFPVTAATVEQLKASASDRATIHLRYNAYLPGWRERVGERRVECRS